MMWSSLLFDITDAVIYFFWNSAKLRARQKERLAQRNAIEVCNPNEGLPVPESLLQCPPTNEEDGDQAMELLQQVREKSSVIDLEDSKFNQPLDALKSKADSTLRLGRLSKHKMSSNLDLTVNCHGHPSSDIIPPGHQNQGTGYTNSLPSNLLPVLGLCAPNANQLEPSHRNFSRSNGRQNKPGTGPEFPFSLPPCSRTLVETDVNCQEIMLDKPKLQDASSEVLQRLKSSLSDGWLPFIPVLSHTAHRYFYNF